MWFRPVRDVRIIILAQVSTEAKLRKVGRNPVFHVKKIAKTPLSKRMLVSPSLNVNRDNFSSTLYNRTSRTRR